jgi:hypothetical protein
VVVVSSIVGGSPAALAGLGAAVLFGVRDTFGDGGAVLLARLAALFMCLVMSIRMANRFAATAAVDVPLAIGAALVCRGLMGRIGLLPPTRPYGSGRSA